jgi:hypothetical protein
LHLSGDRRAFEWRYRFAINASRKIRLIASGLLGLGSDCCAIHASSAVSSSG